MAVNCVNSNSPRHFPQCTTCCPLLLKFVTRVPMEDSSVKPSELRRRLMMPCPAGIPSVFLGDDGRNGATEFPDCFLTRIGFSLAGLTGLASASRVFEFWVTGSVLLIFSCYFIINKVIKFEDTCRPLSNTWQYVLLKNWTWDEMYHVAILYLLNSLGTKCCS